MENVQDSTYCCVENYEPVIYPYSLPSKYFNNPKYHQLLSIRTVSRVKFLRGSWVMYFFFVNLMISLFFCFR